MVLMCFNVNDLVFYFIYLIFFMKALIELFSLQFKSISTYFFKNIEYLICHV